MGVFRMAGHGRTVSGRLTSLSRVLVLPLALPLALLAGLVAAGPARAGSGTSGETSGAKAPAEFVALSDIDPTILQEMRYFTPHNFVGVRINGYEQPLCILTRPAAEALHRAQVTLLAQGYSLKVYDCYRPQRAVDHFVAWAEDLDDEAMKAEFYPDVDKSRLFLDGYIAAKSGHSRGSTTDLTIVKLPAVPTRPYRPGEPLVPCYAPQAERFPDNSVDMGTGFDCFDTLSHTLDPRIQGEQLKNRLLLKNTLEDLGFVNLAEEWWHYTYKPELFPDTYFDFPVSRASLLSAAVGP
ncbi:M15 family metallopeptidase [Streptomyces sp. NBC_01537]|uniref:M15 family metallopeptidase n=1 Tax=Streptomyces sp. NBC_01537 TaxID=2903896 RepID=UPI00386B3871